MPFDVNEGPGGPPQGAGGATVTYGDGSFAGWGPGGEMVLGGSGSGGLDSILAGLGSGGGGDDAFTQTGMGSQLGMGGGIMPIKFRPGDLLRLIRETTGVSISLAGIVALVKKVGVVMAATALGLDPGTFAKLMGSAVAKTSRRRRRGVTGRQLANAKRVNRTIGRMYHELARTFGHQRAATRTIVVGKRK